MILAFDTSSALTSVAIVDDGRLVAAESHLDSRRHAEVLAPMLQSVLGRSAVGRDEITAIACGVGPGPYTGLRVAIATAIAVGTAWGRPVLGVCSLDAIAEAGRQAAPGVAFLVASDARRREVYWAEYDVDGRRVEGPLVSRPDEIDARQRAIPCFGEGAVLHPASLVPWPLAGVDADVALLYPHAEWVARRVQGLLASGVVIDSAAVPLSAHGEDGASTSSALRGVDLLPPRPLYLRRPDAVEAKR